MNLLKTFWLPLLFLSAPVLAAEFRAEIDRTEIASDESVSLKLIVQADGSVPVEAPSFKAPDFDTINEYQSQFVESYYENGKVGARFSHSFTFVLRPKKTGALRITDIQVSVEGQTLQSAPLSVSVEGGGAATPPPRGYGGGGSGLRGAGKANAGSAIFMRAEVDKTKVYKGEQIIVSYFLYSRVSQFNATADKFPVLPGFLKEELEMPIVQGRMQDDIVTLDGQVYKRVLLARFAAYPLKEGKLSVDPFGVKVNYYDPRSRGNPGGEDLESDDIFQQFFRQAAPLSAHVKSPPVTVEVLSLPDSPPVNYTGAVGEFNLSSAVDRSDVKANEALTLTLKVEGQGNLSTLDTPKITLPEGVEVFESRAQTKSGQGGVGVRVFEYLLIPRKSGEWVLPPIELSFFDPKTKSFVKKSTSAIPIHVAEGDPNAAANVPPPALSQENRDIPVPEKAIQKFYGLKSKLGQAVESWGVSGVRWWILLLFVLGMASLLIKLIWPSLSPILKKWRPNPQSRSQKEKDWEKLKQSVAADGKTLNFREVLQAYEKLSSRIYDALDARYQVGARALSRSELREILVIERKMSEDLWSRISDLLEFAETVRFASLAGAVTEVKIRQELKKRVAEMDDIESGLDKKV